MNKTIILKGLREIITNNEREINKLEHEIDEAKKEIDSLNKKD